MSVIEKVIRMENKGNYSLVHVRMSDGLEAQVYVGGECETYLHRGVIKAFVKRFQHTKGGTIKEDS